MLLFIIFTTLYCLAVSASRLDNATIQARDRSFTFDNVFWVSGGTWACKEKRISELNNAIDEARAVTQLAVQALRKPGSEKSEAYKTWFGKGNASPEIKNSILKNNYEALLRNLVRPTSRTYYDRHEQIPFPKLSNNPKTVTTQSLVFACPPEEQQMCHRGSDAFVISAKETWDYTGTTFLAMCPDFFGREKAMAEQAAEWRHNRKMRREIPRSIILIHEFQHMARATGFDNHRTDVQDPWSRGNCYSPECCQNIPDESKIRNAENYGRFAAHVYTWPKTIKKRFMRRA
ncbi:hypothetical protein LZ30DRAFT_594837 [Colletotrichum cereale]|nr:hypothetical protein LZ30DRAFT_594837 [Colletotrichum cereale]